MVTVGQILLPQIRWRPQALANRSGPMQIAGLTRGSLVSMVLQQRKLLLTVEERNAPVALAISSVYVVSSMNGRWHGPTQCCSIQTQSLRLR